MLGRATCATLDAALCATEAAAARRIGGWARAGTPRRSINRPICAQPAPFLRSKASVSTINHKYLIAFDFGRRRAFKNEFQPVAEQGLFDSFSRLITELSTALHMQIGPAAEAQKGVDARASERSTAEAGAA